MYTTGKTLILCNYSNNFPKRTLKQYYDIIAKKSRTAGKIWVHNGKNKDREKNEAPARYVLSMV